MAPTAWEVLQPVFHHSDITVWHLFPGSRRWEIQKLPQNRDFPESCLSPELIPAVFPVGCPARAVLCPATPGSSAQGGMGKGTALGIQVPQT